MLSPILAFRPVGVVRRLPSRSGACPLSGRELLGPAVELGLVLPVVRAPIAEVARGALVAAKEIQAVLGLALPPDVPAEPWFDAVTRAADEIAAGLPIILCAEIVVEGEGAIDLERAAGHAWRLADAGLTHLAIDVGAVAPAERGRVLGEVARAGDDRGVSIEVVVPLGDGTPTGPRAAAMIEEATRGGVTIDLASVRCPTPSSDDDARLQAAALARMCQALAGVPVMRRGPVTPRLLELLRGSPVKACEDGGAAATSAMGSVPDPAGPAGEAPAPRQSGRRPAPAVVPCENADRLEARAYVEAMDFMERLGTRGSAPVLSRALTRELEER